MIRGFACLLVVVALGARADYRLMPGFPQLPPGVRLAGVSGVATDSKGNVFVFHRGETPLLVFEPSGKFIRSFGKGLFKSAHGLRIDKDDNIWTTDNADHVVIKFDHEGKVLMTLGERGVSGEDDRHFNKPADIALGENGTFFIADGYGNSRVVKFDKDGKFLLAWGKKGKGEGEFNLPHAVRIDSKGLVYVGDRENDRVQVFDQNGRFIRQFGGFAPFGLFITPADELFVADGRKDEVHRMTLEGKILETWGRRGPEPGNFFLPHGITVAPDGAVYVTEIDGKRIQKFLPNR
ncbi:MAG TPA: peptidyl-alpha-hydroxyglycine alpha-amidating lyase family protein [Tepidisphaeraceae bacterium]|jgi:DNA-binding beta-propeller fold protein YncE